MMNDQLPHGSANFKGFRFGENPESNLENRNIYGEADAPMAQRIFAFLLDLIGIGIAGFFLFLLNIMTFGLLSPLLLLVMPLLFPIYHTLFVASEMSATPGMWLMGIRVEKDDGESPNLLQSFMLVAVFYVTMSVTGGLILAVALFTENNRCLHDILCGCTIRRRPRTEKDA